MKNLKIASKLPGLLVMVLQICTLSACHDFFEKNIEDNVVKMGSPTDGASSSIYLQKFIWAPINGAREYHIQLVTPSLDNLKQIILDTVTTSTSLSLTLVPNKYQMAIYAQNAGYRSKTTTISFEISESYDLSPQEMNPTLPSNLSATNSSSITFRWDAITGAASYIFELFDANGKTQDGAVAVSGNTITIPSSDNKIGQLTEQAYSWRIFARNEISDSKAAISRFTVDRTAPAQPKSIQPKESDTTRVTTAVFSWTKEADKGTPIADSIIIANDQSFASIIKRAPCINNTFSYTFASTTATYFWKLKQSDAAGNTTETQVRKLLVIPQ